ncbi:MAG: hypothetical protein ACTSYS_13860 [Promethearchaeota archaeon]
MVNLLGAKTRIEKIASISIITLIISLLVWFSFKIILFDIIEQFAKEDISSAKNKLSAVSFVVFFMMIAIFFIVFVAFLMTDITLQQTLIACLLSIVFTVIFMLLISLGSMIQFYPAQFEDLSIEQILLGFNDINTLFIIYVLNSIDLYFLIILVMYFTLSMIYIVLLGGI